MKKLSSKILNIIIVVLIILISCILLIMFFSKDNNEAEENIIPNLVVVNKNLDIPIGSYKKITANIANISNAKLIYTSSNPMIAYVDNKGLVHGLDYGKAVITISYKHTNGETYHDTCEVLVYKGNPKVTMTNASFPEGELVIPVQDEYLLPLIITPNDSYTTNIKYDLDQDGIIKINKDGQIKALKKGRVLVKVSVNNDLYQDELYVNVIEEKKSIDFIKVPTTIEFNTLTIQEEVGATIDLKYQMNPDNANEEYLNWTSSNPNIATVNNGVVTCKAIGKTSITVQALNGVNSKIEITVIEPHIEVTGISLLSSNNVNLLVGNTFQINALVTPSNATNQAINYTSSNSNIASVSENGLITAIGKGTAIITLASYDGNKKATITVNVTKPSSSSSSGSSSSGNSSSGSSSSGNNTDKYYGRICLSYKTEYDSSTVHSSCGKSAQTLDLYLNGQKIEKDSRHEMKVGETIKITVKLPTRCGTPLLLIRTNHDGGTNWEKYFSMSSSPFVNRYNTNTYKNIAQYTWTITATKKTVGYETLSQTAEQCTKMGTIKSMTRIKIKVTN